MPSLKGNKPLVRSILLGIAAIVVGMIIFRKLANKKPPIPPKISFQQSTVSMSTVEIGNHTSGFLLSGRLQALNRFEVLSEVTGVLLNRNFKEGQTFKSGELLVKVDSKEFENQLKSQKSAFLASLSQVLPDVRIDFPTEYAKWEEYVSSINLNSKLKELPEITSSKLKFFMAARGIQTSFYAIQSLEEKLTKFNLYAPYNGVLSEALIQDGTLVRSGQKLGTFVNTTQYEFQASIPSSALSYFQLGKSYKFNLENGTPIMAKVDRINEVVDANSQLINVYFLVSGLYLKEGQFLQSRIEGNVIPNSAYLHRKFLMDGAWVYTVNPTDSTLLKKKVTVHSFNGEQVLITGINSEDLLVNQVLSGAFEGMKVLPVKDLK